MAVPEKKNTKVLVCRACNTEYTVAKNMLPSARCPECSTQAPPPRNPIGQHIKIVD